MRNLVKVNPQQLAHAQVIPHPEINPTPRAIAAGNATHPPVPAQRPAIVQHPPVTAKAEPAPAPRNVEPTRAGEPQHPNEPAPNEARTPPVTARPAPEAPHQNPPAANNRPPVAAPVTVNRPPSTPPQTHPPLVSRTAPPQEKLPYQQKAPAMQEHPGRPLEPQQRANIYAGKPAGPMQDQEFPPHGATHAAPAPAPHGGSAKH